MTLRRKVQVGAVAVLVLLSVPFLFTQRGDYLGPFERTARTLFDGWDMWATESVRPYEDPLLPVPEGAVPTTGRSGYDAALRQLPEATAEELGHRGQEAFRKFCRHCHGPNGDGRTIVGESFGVPLPDLRSESVQNRAERELFNRVFYGTNVMIPLRETVDQEDLLLAIRHIRELADAPSVPYFQQKFATPIGTVLPRVQVPAPSASASSLPVPPPPVVPTVAPEAGAAGARPESGAAGAGPVLHGAGGASPTAEPDVAPTAEPTAAPAGR